MTLVSSRMVRGRCPVCGGEHAVCGPPSGSVPVDENLEVAAVGGPLKKYKVTTPSGVETVMKLNEADAKRLDATPIESDSEAVDLPEAEAERERPQAKARTTSNKSRTAAADKGDG